MKLFFKTIDKYEPFSVEVDMEEFVKDLIDNLKDVLGREHNYTLVYAGKILKKENMLNEYNLVNTIPIIVMETKKVESNELKEYQRAGGNVDMYCDLKSTNPTCFKRG